MPPSAAVSCATSRSARERVNLVDGPNEREPGDARDDARSSASPRARLRSRGHRRIDADEVVEPIASLGRALVRAGEEDGPRALERRASRRRRAA